MVIEKVGFLLYFSFARTTIKICIKFYNLSDNSFEKQTLGREVTRN